MAVSLICRAAARFMSRQKTNSVVVEHIEMSTDQQRVASGLGAEGRARLEHLFDGHFDAVYRFCLARSADRTIAEDAASQAFVEAARTLASDPLREIGERWLFVTARRRLVDGWRRQGREARLTERLGAARVQDSRAIGDESDPGRTRAALRSLPTRQRSALVLRYLDEYSVAEVADALEMSYQASESLLARARRSFQIAWSAGEDCDE